MRENWPDPALPTAANAHHHRHQHRDIDFFTRNYFSVLRWPSPGKGNDDDDSCNCTRRFRVRRNETKTKWMKYISVKSGVNEEDWHSVWERECVYKKEREGERKRERERERESLGQEKDNLRFWKINEHLSLVLSVAVITAMTVSFVDMVQRCCWLSVYWLDIENLFSYLRTFL